MDRGGCGCAGKTETEVWVFQEEVITYGEWLGPCGLCEPWMNEADGRWDAFGNDGRRLFYLIDSARIPPHLVLLVSRQG
jgi:hypothetical protein